MKRHQRGYIYEASKSFYVRYYTGQMKPSGKPEMKSHQLCPKTPKFYSRKCREVQMLADEFMATINAEAGTVQAEDVTVTEFWTKTYEPFATENLRHSTVYSYRQIWAQHLEKHFGTITLRDYRTHMGSQFVTGLSKTFGRATVQHIRSLASGIFAHALNLGLLETNVWHDVKVLGKSRPPEETQHYNLEEAENIVTALVDHPKGQALMALACFAGLRPGELQGLRWTDLDPDFGSVHIRRSVVRGVEGELKTKGSTRSLPLIAPVRLALMAWRRVAGENERVFAEDLATVTRAIQPVLKASGITWKGLYAGRRGAATILTELTGDALAANELLGHANLSVTTAKYVKTMPEALLRGMKLLEAATK
jgi:integrase